MTVRERIRKNLLFGAIVAYYLGGYFLINELTASRIGLHQLALPFEKDLPFLPAFIFGYLLVFCFQAFGYLVVDDLPFFKKMIRSFFFCTNIHFLFFLVYPVVYTLRPEVDYHGGWIYKLVAFYYWLDLPYNCFPSMHISNVFLIAFFLDRYRPGWGRVLVPLAGLVAASVVLVKQHYIADVVAGLAVAYAVFRSVFGSKARSMPRDSVRKSFTFTIMS